MASPLKVFDRGDGDQRIIKHLGEVRPAETFSQTEVKMLQKFLNGELLEAIDMGGVQKAVETAKKLVANPKYVEQITIKTVFRATEKVPLRALAYPLPAIYLAEEIGKQNGGKTPKIELVFMLQAGISANNLNKEVVCQEACLLIDQIKKYVGEFHSELLPYISFTNDLDFTPTVMVSNDFARLVDVLRQDGQNEQLVAMGENHGGREESLGYGVLHSYIHDMVPSDNQTDLIISVGAQPERHFYKTRQKLRGYLGQIDSFRLVRTIQYLAPFNVPPYQPLASCDPLLADVINDFDRVDLDNIHTPVRQAIEMLSDDAGGVGLLFAFISSTKRR